MPGPYYFAWVAEGEAFDPDVHNRFDERVLSIEIDHSEGDIPNLTISLKNPRVGLLSAGRNVWCWLSFNPGTGIPIPMFHGRLVGIPSDLHKNAVQLEFTARPPTLPDLKQAMAEDLKELPWWDDLWVDEAKTNPDSVLESRSLLFHIDRTDLTLSLSDVLQGEDEMITVEDHLYESLSVSFGETPKRRIDVTAEISFKQEGHGDVDLTDQVHAKFQTVGSPFNWPLVGSYTSDGLADDWPQPLDDLGGGWSMAATSVGAIYQTDAGQFSWDYQKVWTDKTADAKTEMQLAAGGNAIGGALNLTYVQTTVQGDWVDWTAVFQVKAIDQHFIVHFDASRDRTEKITFSVEADVQPLLVDPEGTDVKSMEFSSSFVDKPVDPGDALPIGDTRRNCYFPTDRGMKSVEHLLLLARAELRFSSRAVNMTFTVPRWITDISCRKSVTIVDPRLPGGQASGKITNYKLSAKGKRTTEITIGCAAGKGVALPAAAGGDDVYATNYSRGYTRREGAEVEVLEGELVYEPLDASVVDDDGVDLFNMVPSTVLQSLTITNGPNDQQFIIDEACKAGGTGVAPDPIGALKEAATTVELQLVPVDGGAFFTEYALVVQPLVIPKLIDLEAPSV